MGVISSTFCDLLLKTNEAVYIKQLLILEQNQHNTLKNPLVT